MIRFIRIPIVTLLRGLLLKVSPIFFPYRGIPAGKEAKSTIILILREDERGLRDVLRGGVVLDF